MSKITRVSAQGTCDGTQLSFIWDQLTHVTLFTSVKGDVFNVVSSLPSHTYITLLKNILPCVFYKVRLLWLEILFLLGFDKCREQ